MSLQGLQNKGPSRKKNNINSCHKVLLDVTAGPIEGPSRKKNNINI
jgi:hypothetical protein